MKLLRNMIHPYGTLLGEWREQKLIIKSLLHGSVRKVQSIEEATRNGDEARDWSWIHSCLVIPRTCLGSSFFWFVPLETSQGSNPTHPCRHECHSVGVQQPVQFFYFIKQEIHWLPQYPLKQIYHNKIKRLVSWDNQEPWLEKRTSVYPILWPLLINNK